MTSPDAPAARSWRLPAFGARSAPLALLLLVAIAFVPLAHRLGFYWDDWPSIWFLHNWGASGFREGFASDRPLLSWLFMLTTPLMGESPLRWQLFGLFTRWLAALALWWTLRGVWPERPVQVFWVALLFALYPGFGQQYIAVTYSNAFLYYALFIFSLGAMVWAYRSPAARKSSVGAHGVRPDWRWTALAILSALLSMLMVEYFLGLELLRPALLWLTLAQVGPHPGPPRERAGPLPDPPRERGGGRDRARLVLWGWAPYLLMFIPYVAYRLLFTSTPRGQIILLDQLRAAPLPALASLVQTIAQDFVEVNFQAWGHGLDPGFLNTFDTNVLLIGAGALLATGLLVAFYLARLEPAADGAEERRATVAWARQALLLGLWAFLVSGWTIWITDLHIELLFPYDRFTLITMIGASLLVAGLVGLLARRRWQSVLILSLIVAFAAGLHYQQRLQYRQEWLAQQNFFWQLSWRAPAIRPGTVLLTSEIPFTYYTDNSLSAPLNWIYASGNTERQMPYILYDIEARLGKGLQAIAPGQPVVIAYRLAGFEGSTSAALVLFYDPPRCLKVLDPEIDRFLPVRPLYIREATPLSQLERIFPEAQAGAARATLPEHLFGAEPAHLWCYHFEKAELYNQTGDYQKAAESADQALKLTKRFTDKNVSELIPFIEAYAHTGRWQEALELSLRANQIWDKTRFPVCDAWKRILATTADGPERQAVLPQLNQTLGCSQP